MVLRVKLEIVPFGDEDKVREIGRLDIFNKGRDKFFTQFHDYGVIVLDKNANTGGLLDEGVFHERRLGAWVLVKEVLAIMPLPGQSTLKRSESQSRQLKQRAQRHSSDGT